MAFVQKEQHGTELPTEGIKSFEKESGVTTPRKAGIARRGLGGFGVSGFNRGKEDKLLNEVANYAIDLFKEYEFDLSVTKVHSYSFNMEYSTVLIGKDAGNGQYFYYAILLGGTGREPQDVHYIVDNMHDKRAAVLKLPCDMLDNRAHDVFKSILAKKHPGKNIQSLDGQVFHAIQTIEHDLLDVLLTSADIVIQHIEELLGEIEDVDADSLLLNADGTKYNHSEIGMIRRGEDIINNDGMPEYSDATIMCEVVEEGAVYRGIDEEKVSTVLTETSVVINLITMYDKRQDGSKVVESIPQVTVKSAIGRSPSMGYALFSLAQATLFCKGAELRGALFEKDIGPMNLLYNFRNLNENGVGNIVSFADKSITENEIGEFISTFVADSAPLLIDIPINGNGYSYLAPFADATAVVKGGSGKLDGATQTILDATSEFLGVAIPDMPVLHTPSFDIPTGYFIDPKVPNDVPHDLGIINEVYIAKLKDVDLLNLWTIANLTPDECISYSGVDNFQLYLTIYERVAELRNLVIKIDGRTVRATLNPEYVEFLSTNLGTVEVDTENGRIEVKRFEPDLKDFVTFEDVNNRMVPLADRDFGFVSRGFATADINRKRIRRSTYNSQQRRY